MDLALEARDGAIVGVEVKAAAVPSGDSTGLRALEVVAGDRFRRGVVLHAGDEHVAFKPES